jgi:hypothetical protein
VTDANRNGEQKCSSSIAGRSCVPDLPRDVTRSLRYRLSVFDAEQKKRDELPDKNFTISAAAELQTVGNRTWA